MTYGPAAPLPNLVLIGSQRGGSTFLHACLGAHPDVFMHRWEEGYFADGFYERYDDDWLRSLFEEAGDTTARGFRSAIMLPQPETAPRVAATLPGARLIAVLRDPLSRSISAFHHYVGLGILPLVPLADGLRHILDGDWQDRYPGAENVVRFSQYGPQLASYLDHVPAEDLLVLIQEELRDDLDGALDQAFTFLEVDPDFRPELPTTKINASTTNPTRQRIRRLGNRFVFANSHDNPLGWVVRDTVAGRLLAAATTRLEKAIPDRWFPNRRPTLPAELEEELRERFAPDVEAVEAHLGREIPAWHRARR